MPMNRSPTLAVTGLRRERYKTRVTRRVTSWLFARMKSYDSCDNRDSLSLPTSDSFVWHALNVLLSHLLSV